MGARQTLRSFRLNMAGDVQWPTTTEMSRLEVWPIVGSSRSVCQSFHWRRTLRPRSPVPEKDKPESLEFLEPMENSCVFRPRARAPFKTACPPSRTCAALVPIVATQTDSTGGSAASYCQAQETGRGDTSESRQDGLGEGKKHGSTPSAQHGTVGRCVSSRLAPLPPPRSRARAFSTMGKEKNSRSAIGSSIW